MMHLHARCRLGISSSWRLGPQMMPTRMLRSTQHVVALCKHQGYLQQCGRFAISQHVGAVSNSSVQHHVAVLAGSSFRKGLQLPSTQRGCFNRIKRQALPPLAMVNVDFASPSLVLGVTLIGCGIALLQVRNMQREVSRDADIVVAAMISIVGSTLIFQGWRLDPLLLLCQALTTSVAFWYGLETFKLRAEIVEDEDQGQDNMPGPLPPLESQMRGSEADFTAATRSGYLPPGSDRPLPPWAQQQQQQLPQQQQQQPMPGYGPSSSNSRWGLPPGEQQVRYDAFAQSSSGNLVPDAMYTGYGAEGEVGSSGRQQQQYIPGAAAGYEGSNGYNNGVFNAAGGVYGQQAFGQQQPLQQQSPLQQQQYGWPPGVPSAAGMPYDQQQGSWYGTPSQIGIPDGLEGYPSQQQQQPMVGGQGYMDPYMAPGATPGVGLLPDGSVGPGLYAGLDGSSNNMPLPLPPGEQQQQAGQLGQPKQSRQRGSRSMPPGAYEQVDDWE